MQNNLQTKIKSAVGFLVGDDNSFDKKGRRGRFFSRLSLFLPLSLSILLLGWTYLVRAPMLKESLMKNLSLIERQERIEQTRIHFSESQIKTLSEEAATAETLLVHSQTEASEILQELKALATTLGLSSTFSEIKRAPSALEETSLIEGSEYRFTLRPDKDAISEQNDLVRILVFAIELSEYTKRIDLVKLEVHTDENAINTATLNILLFHPVSS